MTAAMTFTFGGLRIEKMLEVLNTDGVPIRGLYAAGELVGGLFYFNYPGGTGLMSGRSSAKSRYCSRQIAKIAIAPPYSPELNLSRYR